MELKKRFSKEERLKESEKMLSKFKDRVPVVCEKIKNNSIKELEKK